MCIALPFPNPVITPLPTSFPDSFPPSQQSHRGPTTWSTLFSTSLSAGIASCPSNGFLGLHRHVQPELYHVLSGTGIIEIEGKTYELSKGMTVFVPGDVEHGVRNEGGEEFRWLYVFPGKFEEVEYRFREEGEYEVGEKEGKGAVKAKL